MPRFQSIIAAVLVLAATAATLSNVAAQAAPAPRLADIGTPTDTETSIPTETPTETPTATDTPTVTASPVTATPPWQVVVTLPASGASVLIERRWTYGEEAIFFAVLGLCALVALRWIYEVARREVTRRD